ncbi:MAG: aminotransferase class I/II-fold pyridoxal phosphate-dependent enzyme [Gemmatimonadetes bacterium]|nr:aminotransferase class I/II-fold pyridoxal phosphate-dependent enzyme [Gemmatimonadota bacterium]
MDDTTVALPVSRQAWSPPGRLNGLPPYPLADVPDIKARLLAEGRTVIDLGVGDPGLPVPDAAVETLREAVGNPALSKYGFQRGLPEYREAIARWLGRRFGADVDPDLEVLPVIGSKEAIALTAFAVLDPGDSVLVPDPGYAPYFGGPYFAGADVIRFELRAEEGYLIPPDAIRRARGRLRLVYINYPNNPTSAVAEISYLQEVVEACRERGAVLLFDNAYSEITFDGFRAPGLLEIEGAREVGIEFHSMSKTYNMTGWRLGWATGDRRLIGALRRVKTFFDTGAFMAVQAAGAAVLEDPDEYIRWNLDQLGRRRDAAVAAFQAAGLDVTAPRGTLYLWFAVPGEEKAEDFCRRLLIDSGVVLLPGSAMGPGGEGFVRASLAIHEDRWEEAGRRIQEAL